MTQGKPAHLTLRFLAFFDDLVIFFLPVSLFLFFVVANAQTLYGLIYNVVLLLILIIFPLLILKNIIYDTFLTSYYGGTLGKLVTGLRVINEDGKNLKLKSSLFRHTVGYGFSSMLFGLGFWSIINDPNKQGWHDKIIGSRVVVAKPLWPLALLLFAILVGTHFFLISASINKISTGPLTQQFSTILQGANLNLANN